MIGLGQRLDAIRASGDPSPLVDLVPFARFMGIQAHFETGELLCRMVCADHLVGNPMVPALHGGGLGALLETTALMTVLWQGTAHRVPRTVTITFDYLRPARLEDTWASATVLRQGRRVMTLKASAWQGDRDRPVAAATAHLMVA